MKETIKCPQCQGRGTVLIYDRKKMDETGVFEWLDCPCPTCRDKKFIILDTDKLEVL